MIIGIAVTRNWYIYMATNLYALFKYNKIKKVYMFIEDDEISYLKDERIEFINVNKLPEYIKETSPNYKTFFTKMTFARCYFTKVLKDDKIIYIDADAIVVDNINNLWNLKLGNNVIAGVHEGGEWDAYLGQEGFDDTYINSGVLLMDLKKLREEKLDDKILEIINTEWHNLPDQDAINLVCKGRIKHISNIYNSTDTTGYRDDAKIIHYIRGSKGWIKGSPRSEIWYNYHKEMIGGNKMDNYYVIAKINFNDYEGKDINNPNNEFVERIANESKWWCSAERYNYLKENNAVELIEIKKVELPKEPIKSTKSTFVSKTKKSKK